MSLTELVQRSHVKDVLHEQGIALYEDMVYTTNPVNISNVDQWVIEQNHTSSDLIGNLNDGYLLVNWAVQYSDRTAWAGATAAANRVALQNSAWSLFDNIKIDLSNEPLDFVQNPGLVYNTMVKVSKTKEWVNQHYYDNFYYVANGEATVAGLMTVFNPFSKQLLKVGH
jgi:hypothetical protein